MTSSDKDAAALTREFVCSLSPDAVQRLVRLLRLHPTLGDLTRARIMREVANDSACERIASFVTALSAMNLGISPQMAAFGIECALEGVEHEAKAQSVDLVWTGPETSTVPLRRSAAVLLELIENARSDLILMSFASFRIPDVEAALSRAAERGVRLYLILESEDESSGRYRQYGLSAFGALIQSPRISYYCWPKTKRPSGALLHAKAVVSDGINVLVTSANLTERAIDSNIELGILIRGGDLSMRVHAHIMALIHSGEFEAILLGPA